MRSRSASAGFCLLLLFNAAVDAEPVPHCARAGIVLWGDGKHDDTFALNAWLRGEDAVWAENGDPVGDTIAGRGFRLSSAIYVAAGSGRALHNFRFLWPERGETVSGGTIISGSDPDQAPVTEGVQIVGGDAGEGVPFDHPDVTPVKPDARAGCPIS